MAKYNKEIVKDMCDWVRENGLIDYGGARLGEFCRHFKIDDVTYYNWMRKSEYSEAIKKAKEDFKNNLETDIVFSLSKAAKGYNVEEVTTEGREVQEGDKKVFKAVKQIRKKKHIECNVGAAIFLLTNIAPDKWKNKRDADYTDTKKEDDAKKYNLAVIPQDDIIALANKMQDARYEQETKE